jgi:endonuclease/exonuclease/phosphatase family metal-dependent hydrolase
MSLFSVATFNVLNLACPGVQFYDSQLPYSEQEHERRCKWIGSQMDLMAADIVACQEVFNVQALRDALACSKRMVQAQVLAPYTDQSPLLPRLALVSRFPVLQSHSHTEIALADQVTPPGSPPHTHFSRPVLEALIDVNGQPVRVFTVHLKSKRPDLLEGENAEDPAIYARGMARSLARRTAEALAVRQIIIQRLWHTREPLIVLGDFNDLISAATTQLISATSFRRGDEHKRDCMLFDAFDLQRARHIPYVGAQRRDTTFTYAHEQVPETIDHILVSEEFAPFSRNAAGFVVRVDYFNDHLVLRKRGEPEARIFSDHGQVVAQLNLHATAPKKSQGLRP